MFFLLPLPTGLHPEIKHSQIYKIAVQEHTPTLNHVSTGRINPIVSLIRSTLCMKYLDKQRVNKLELFF